jgi:aspartate racemase
VTSITGIACATVSTVRTIGVLGGITWHSAAEYYRLLNSLVAERTGGEHAARCVLVSVDIGEIDPLMHAGRWQDAAALVSRDAVAVEAAGADVFVLACNSLHTGWEAIVGGLSIPTIHIADAAAGELEGRRRVALLGTPWTMELPFFRERLERRGFDVVVPADRDRARLGSSVFDELSHGIVRDETRAYYVDLIGRLGVDAAVLACTEMTLLSLEDAIDVPLVDTARAHTRAAVDYALNSV